MSEPTLYLEDFCGFFGLSEAAHWGNQCQDKNPGLLSNNFCLLSPENEFVSLFNFNSSGHLITPRFPLAYHDPASCTSANSRLQQGPSVSHSLLEPSPFLHRILGEASSLLLSPLLQYTLCSLNTLLTWSKLLVSAFGYLKTVGTITTRFQQYSGLRVDHSLHFIF